MINLGAVSLNMLYTVGIVLAMLGGVNAVYMKSFVFGDALGLRKVVGIKRDILVLMDIEEARLTMSPTVFTQVGSSIEIDSGKVCNYPVGAGSNSIEICRFVDSDTEWIVSEPNAAGEVQIYDPSRSRCIGYDVVEARTTANLKAIDCNGNAGYKSVFRVLRTSTVRDEGLYSSINSPIYPVKGTRPSDEFSKAFFGGVNPTIYN